MHKIYVYDWGPGRTMACKANKFISHFSPMKLCFSTTATTKRLTRASGASIYVILWIRMCKRARSKETEREKMKKNQKIKICWFIKKISDRDLPTRAKLSVFLHIHAHLKHRCNKYFAFATDSVHLQEKFFISFYN